MRTCMQSTQMSVLDHGIDVARKFWELTDHVTDGSPLSHEWIIPGWVGHPVVRQCFDSFDPDVIGLYQTYHDCGKPLCLIVDAEGRRQYPDHANVSADRWLACSDGSTQAHHVAALIRMDMDVHLLRVGGVSEFASRPEALPLLITALCEVTSNAQMFGGIGSTSYKIKWKHIDRMGRKIIDAIVAQRQS